MRSSFLSIRYLFIVIFAFSISCECLLGQERSESKDEFKSQPDTDRFRNHSLALLVSHTFISKGLGNSRIKAIIVPSWALNYNYRFNEKWSLGLHTDIIIEDFVIERNVLEEASIEREYPIATIIVGACRITRGLSLVAGAGVEWEKNEDFRLIRLGSEYGINIPGINMEAMAALNYDILIDAYNSVNIGIGIAKQF